VCLPGVLRLSLERFFEIEGIDRAVVLSAQAFSALIPLVIVTTSVAPGTDRSDLSKEIIERFDLTGASAETVRSAFSAPSGVTESTTYVGVLVALLSALAFTRALQRLYQRAWRLPPSGVRANLWGLLWLTAFVVYFILLSAVSTLVSGAGKDLLSLASTFTVWLLTPWLLLGRRLPWRTLVPQAIFSAVGLTALGIGLVIVMPRIVASAAAQYGLLGVSFALLTWLLATSFTLVVAAALGAAVGSPAQGDAVSPDRVRASQA
jgi:membrane protein